MTEEYSDEYLLSVRNAFRTNNLDEKVCRNLARVVRDKCKPVVGVFPIADSLIVFVRRVSAAVPIKFLLRNHFFEFVDNLRVFAFLIFLQFIVHYDVRRVCEKYEHTEELRKDYAYMLDDSLPKISYQISKFGKESQVWKAIVSVSSKMARTVLTRSDTNIFTSDFFTMTIFPNSYTPFYGLTMDLIIGKKREPIYIDKNGQTRKRKAKEAFEN